MAGFPLAYIFFSTLRAQSSIAPHYGACNLRLRGHLPLVTVPAGQSRLRVGDYTREWEAGKLMLFDDTFEHEAHNESTDGDRVVLLFDIWHPDLSVSERAAMCRMFEGLKKPSAAS
jgi:aspartyl/asparaginyl beta-hydroxylase (cupin superfamily)